MAKSKAPTRSRSKSRQQNPDVTSPAGEDPGTPKGGPREDPTGKGPESKSQSRGQGSSKQQGPNGESAPAQPVKGESDSKAHKNSEELNALGQPIPRQCTATSRHTGERCRQSATIGLTVCRFHGGGGKRMRELGRKREEKREALARASRMVQKDGVDMDPIDHLLDCLYRASQLVNVYGIMCAEIDEGGDEQLSDDQTRGELGYEIVEEELGDSGRTVERFIVHSKEKLMTLNKHSEAQLHPFLEAYAVALRDKAKFAKMAIDAGIAEMQTQLVERQVDMAQEALEAAILEMHLDKAARRAFVESYARNLREISARGSTVPAALLGAG